MSLMTIPFHFIGTAHLGNRLFRGEATLSEDHEGYIVSGSALKRTGRTLVTIYWISGWAVFIGSFILLVWLASRTGCYTTSPTVENFSKNTGKLIIDLVVTVLSMAGGVNAAMLFCRYVFRERALERLLAAEVSAVIKGKTFVESQWYDENQPPIQMRYVTIKMKNSKQPISISCREEYVNLLSSLLGVPLEDE